MNNSIKVNNQTMVQILETIEGDKGRYPELWEIISGKEFDWEEYKKDSTPGKEKIKIIGNLGFANLKKIESPKLLAELTERMNRGEMILKLVSCCQISNYFNFAWKTMEQTNKYEDHCFSATRMFIFLILALLKKEEKLCTKCSEYLNHPETKNQAVEEITKEGANKKLNEE